MGFKLNLTADEVKQAQGGPIPALPAAKYGATVYSAVQKKSKAQNEMFEIDFKLTEGPVPVGKRKQRGWFALTPAALFKYVELAKATGHPYPKKDDIGEFEFPEAEDFVGIDVLVQLGVENYNTVDDDGNDLVAQRNTLDKVLPYDADKITTAEELEEGESAEGGLFL